MSLSFLDSAQFGFLVRRTPWSATDALVGLLGLDEVDCVSAERVQGDPRGPGGPPHDYCKSSSIGKTKWHWDGIPRRVVNPSYAFTKSTYPRRGSVLTNFTRN